MLYGCSNEYPDREIVTLELPLGLDSKAQYIPEDNPLTKAKIDLGRQLFFDERLSVDATVSCAFCHNPLVGFQDGRYFATGVLGNKGPRNTSTIFNRVFSREQFLDGRAKNIEEVVLEHIQNPLEMNNTLENLVDELNSDELYLKAFKKAFGTQVTADGIAKATACFVRTLVTGDSPYDKFMAGDKNALSESAQRGLKLFQSKELNCISCHTGANLTDEKFHYSSIHRYMEDNDPGLFNVTKIESDRYKFKTPTLRNLDRTSPYMHNGSTKGLIAIVDTLNKDWVPYHNLNEKVKPLNLTDQEKKDLVNFFKSLTGRNTLFMGNL